ncbi:MAG: S8 family serine peptidase [Defluviitaleaceae bacterium]|nr:S8 family serine peptidase [Defluviitaleaceae bacterium]
MKALQKLTTALILLLALNFFTLTNLYANEPSYLDQTAKLIADNWDDNFITEIVFTVGSPYMTVDGVQSQLDTAPVIVNESIMLPLRTLVEQANGDISFDEQKITVTSEQTIELEINSVIAFVDGSLETVDAPPMIINNRTMIDTETAAELLGFEAEWNTDTDEIILTRDFQTRRLFVKTAPSFDFSGLGATAVVHWPDDEAFVQFDTILQTREAYEALSANKDVVWVEPDYVISGFSEDTQAVSGFSDKDNDPPRSWGVSSVGLDSYARYLIEQGRTNRQIVVAVVDSGLDASHEFFYGRIHDGEPRCFITNTADTHDWNGHGTHVSGIVVDGTPKVNNIKIFPVRVLNSSKSGTVGGVNSGIRHAIANNADIIVLSLGAQISPSSFQSTINAAEEAGVLVIAASGNNGINAATVAPANVDLVFTVGSVNILNVPATSSNWGSPPLDLCAPGVSINSTAVGGGYRDDSGTSMAAPFAAAAAAMYLMNNPSLSPAQLRTALRAYARTPAGWDTSRQGVGILSMTSAPRIRSVTSEPYVGTMDLLYIIRHIMGHEGFEEIDVFAADINGDGVVDFQDVSILSKWLVGNDAVLSK